MSALSFLGFSGRNPFHVLFYVLIGITHGGEGGFSSRPTDFSTGRLLDADFPLEAMKPSYVFRPVVGVTQHELDGEATGGISICHPVVLRVLAADGFPARAHENNFSKECFPHIDNVPVLDVWRHLCGWVLSTNHVQHFAIMDDREHGVILVISLSRDVVNPNVYHAGDQHHVVPHWEGWGFLGHNPFALSSRHLQSSVSP